MAPKNANPLYVLLFSVHIVHLCNFLKKVANRIQIIASLSRKKAQKGPIHVTEKRESSILIYKQFVHIQTVFP